jgi:putative hydrolase of the HAD superfamily
MLRKEVSVGDLEGLKGVLFDCYKTLIDIRTDETHRSTWDSLSRWLLYHGVRIDAKTLRDEYRNGTHRLILQAGERHPEIRVEEVFSDIIRRYRIWEQDEYVLGCHCARAFRSASLRRKRVFPESLRLLEHFHHLKRGLVSNGQRIFSEPELRHLDLHQHFDVIVYSSDLGYKKPDPRIFFRALDTLSLAPEDALFVGDSYENDLAGAEKIGMRACHIRDAWLIPDMV